MTLDDALGERMAGVRAGILEGEEGVAHAKHTDFDAADEDAKTRPGRQIPHLPHTYKGHRLSGLAEVSQCAWNHVILPFGR